MKSFLNKLTNNFQTISLLILFAVLLSGCQLSYHSKQHHNIEAEYVLLDHTIDQSVSIDDFSFTPFDPSSKVPFDPNTYLLLKVKLFPDPNQPVAKEYTLSVFPKYLTGVDYFQVQAQGIQLMQSQYRIQGSLQSPYSSERYAFNIDDADLSKTHLLLVKSQAQRYVNLELFDTLEYTRLDSQHSQFFTFVYSLIFSMVIFNLVFYFYSRETPYVLYAIYMLVSLNSLLWQEGKINDLPILAWQIMGASSPIVYIFLNALTGLMFFYNFMKLNAKESWWVKVLLLVIGLQAGLVIYTLIKYHVVGAINYIAINDLFNWLTLCYTLLILVIIIIKTIQKQQQAIYLLWAWGFMLTGVLMRITFAFNPRPEFIWLAHSYELAVMLEGLVLAFAIGNRSKEFKKQRDQAVNKYSKAERSIYKHRLLNQFQVEMQNIAKDSTLNAEEVAEKTNIKFHLMLTRAFPIKNSLILEGDELKGVCTTGIDVADMDFLKHQAMELQNNQESTTIEQKVIGMSGNKQSSVLFIPLNKSYKQPVTFILNLKTNDTIKTNVLTDLQNFCGHAYNELLRAKEMYQVALAANMDSLTQCYNRSSIENIIQQSLNQLKLTTIAYVDLDNLKQINDQYGHPTGDQCIIQFAQLLEQNITPFGKVGRIGGDEFLVVFSAIEFDSCTEHLEAFMQSLKTIKVSEHDLTLTCSIGIAESRMKETTRSLVKKADKALYHSKEQGRNQMTSYEQMLS